MKKTNNVLVRVRCAAVVCLVCLMAAALSGCDFSTFSDRSLENPKLALTGFVEAMQAETFDQAAAEEAMSYVGNYSSMGFEKYAMAEDDPLEKELFDMLRGSYAVEFANSDFEPISVPYQGVDMNVSGKQAFVTVTFSSLDLEKISGPLAEMVSEVGGERVYDGAVYDTEESALALVEEVFPMVLETIDLDECCIRRELILELNYHEGGWKINISDEFYNALLGK